VSAVEAALAHKATRREWIGLAVIALPCMLYSMDLTVLNLAVPTLTADIKPTASELLWIIDVYGFMVAGFLVAMGSLGDRIGRRKLLLMGAAVFGITSVIAAYADTPATLIAARALLGIAGATIAPSTLSLISNMFRDEKEQAFAISMWVAAYSVGAIIGPLVGGFLIQYFSWGSVFLANVPVMLLLLAVGPFLLPEHKDPNPGPIDFTSVFMSLASVLSIIYGLKQFAENGLGLLAALVFLAGIVLLVAFVRRQYRLEHPFIDPKLFELTKFRVAIAVNFTGIFFMFGTFIFMAQYLQLVAGLTPLEAGLWSVPGALAFTGVSFLTPLLMARLSVSSLITAGLVVSAVGLALLAATDSFALIIVANIIMSVGFTPVITMTTGLIVGSAPPEKAGVASAISETGAELGGALGVALLGSLGTAIYRRFMMDKIAPGLSPEASEAARMTLGGAVEAAKTLPEIEGAAMVEAARQTFMTGFHLAALLSVVALLIAAWMTYRVLGGPERQAQSDVGS
jgi:MFS transporter, DHA2 family, multidrug resistance protein